MKGYVVQIDAHDPVGGATIALRLSSHDDDRICHLDGQTWWPAVATLPARRYDLFSGAFDGQITSPNSTLTISGEPWPNIARYLFADARVRIWSGEIGTAWASWEPWLEGRIKAQPAIDEGMVPLTIGPDDSWLDTPILAPYAGTTGAEGPAALKGTVKPLALGAPRYAGGVLIDPINTVIQLSGYGPIEGVEVAMERLARFGASMGDYGNYAALVAATITPGRWATCRAQGLVRHGAPPEGKLSYMLRGDNGGPDGWARLPGELIRRVALLAGGAGRIDDASLDALDARCSWPLSIMVTEQTTARDLIQRIAASINAVAGVSWLGQLFVAPVGLFPTGAALLRVTEAGDFRVTEAGDQRITEAGEEGAFDFMPDGSALPPVATIRQVEVGAPWWRNEIEAERTWSVHSYDEVAFTAPLVDMGDYAPGTTYREGNIVDMPDGSRWLYINPTPTAGNAPPVGTMGNIYWSRYSGPLDPTEIGIEDGATRNVERGAWAPDTDYLAGDFVSHGGKRYKVLADHRSTAANPPPNSYVTFVGDQVDPGSIDTDKIEPDAVNDVESVASATTWPGNGSTYEVISYALDLAAGAKVICDLSGQHSYSAEATFASPKPWQLQIRVNGGAPIAEASGSGAMSDSFSTKGHINLPAGEHEIAVEWFGTSGMSLRTALMVVQACKR